MDEGSQQCRGAGFYAGGEFKVQILAGGALLLDDLDGVAASFLEGEVDAGWGSFEDDAEGEFNVHKVESSGQSLLDACSQKCEHGFVPQAEVVFYQDGEEVLFYRWLDSLPVKVQAKCLSLVRLLRSLGHELRRPMADFLRDGIYELRPTYQGVHYRILYFFSGKNVVVISHGLTKESEVSDAEINRAIERKRKYGANPKAHGWKG